MFPILEIFDDYKGRITGLEVEGSVLDQVGGVLKMCKLEHVNIPVVASLPNLPTSRHVPRLLTMSCKTIKHLDVQATNFQEKLNT